MPSVGELQRIADNAVPCLLLTPIDCFWEGSILQEPDEPVSPVTTRTCQEPSPSDDVNGTAQNITWGNINFTTLTNCLSQYPPSNYTPFVNLVRIYLLSSYSIKLFLLHQQNIQAAEVTGYIGKKCFSRLECPPTNEVLIIKSYSRVYI